MEIRMEGPPFIKPMHAYHFNPLASHLDSSNVRMSPLQIDPFALHMVGAVTVSQEFDVN